MLVRRFTKTDAKEVSDLIIRTLMISNTKDYPADMMEELSLRMQPEDILSRAERAHYYVIEVNAAIVGCGAIGPCPDRKDESILLNLFVLPEFQGRGIGRRIVETLEQDEYALKSKRIELSASITGLSFYRRLGYDYINGVTAADGEGLYQLEKYR